MVGFPNVGKSTLVNRLAGGREAVVHSEAGVTRDRKVARVRVERARRSGWSTPAASTSPPRTRCPGRSSARRARRSPTRTWSLLVVDARAGPGPGDAEVVDILRRSQTPVLVVANKVDRAEDEPLAAELHALGFGEPHRRSRPPTATGPATCSTAWSSCSGGRRREAQLRTPTRRRRPRFGSR